MMKIKLLTIAFVLMIVSCSKDLELNDFKPSNGIKNGHEWIDLGLSVKWATCNVGASKPEEYGDYFAWGETSPKSSYTQTNHTCNRDNYYYYACRDNGATVLRLSDDAAYCKWGNGWRTPTRDELKELYAKCKREKVKVNNVVGWNFTGPSGKAIFIPANGYKDGVSLVDVSSGYYWSSLMTNYSAYDNYSPCLRLGLDGTNELKTCDGYKGLGIRPVCE